ncbi:MAG TPA: prepilin peptidase [Candidatus Saccharimonadales bacterium]|jgi:prepilin signal peptidase PulO-like enzyme (type II secretory pathway)
MVIVILLLLGICFGSFVNAFVWRFHEQAEIAEQKQQGIVSKAVQAVAGKLRGKRQLTADELSITKGRSMCVHCYHELAAKDLIPVFSYLWLRGRCRYCGQPIQDTPLPELVTPLLFVVSYLFWPMPLSGAGLFVFCLWLVFLVGFVALSLYDLRWYELPHRIVLPLIGLALLQTVVVSTIYGGGLQTLGNAVAGALIGGGLFYLLYTFSPKIELDDGTRISKWIGGGDITLGTLLGLLVGGPGNALLLIFTASLIGTIIAVPLLAVGRADRGSHLPFGPFLMAGAIIVMLWGARLIDWYTNQLAL